MFAEDKDSLCAKSLREKHESECRERMWYCYLGVSRLLVGERGKYERDVQRVYGRNMKANIEKCGIASWV